jgi:hypothetical protein
LPHYFIDTDSGLNCAQARKYIVSCEEAKTVTLKNFKDIESGKRVGSNTVRLRAAKSGKL